MDLLRKFLKWLDDVMRTTLIAILVVLVVMAVYLFAVEVLPFFID